MDERMVDRPHHNGFCSVVCQPRERQPERRRLLASWVGVNHSSRRMRDVHPGLDDRHNGAQITFGRDPNHRIQEAFTAGQTGDGLRLSVARALAGGEDRACDRNFLDGLGGSHGCREKRVAYRLRATRARRKRAVLVARLSRMPPRTFMSLPRFGLALLLLSACTRSHGSSEPPVKDDPLANDTIPASFISIADVSGDMEAVIELPTD